jgi:hypothetical protein
MEARGHATSRLLYRRGKSSVTQSVSGQFEQEINFVLAGNRTPDCPARSPGCYAIPPSPLPLRELLHVKHQHISHEVSIQFVALMQVLTFMKSFLEAANMLWLGLL